MRKRYFTAFCLTLCSVAGAAVYISVRDSMNDSQVEGEITGSVSSLAQEVGPSGLPLPRFVSLKSEKVNVRKGPSSDHEVAWVFQRKGMPVEITAEFENWRKIRDSEGAEGWILQQMLSGKRSAIVMSYDGQDTAPLHSDMSADTPTIAQLAKGVTGYVKDCDGNWCEFQAQGYDGYISQSKLWGVYPNEHVN